MSSPAQLGNIFKPFSLSAILAVIMLGLTVLWSTIAIAETTKPPMSVLRVGAATLARSPDPHFGANWGDTLLYDQVYEGLVDTDGNRTIVPKLAESWEWTGDGWLFHLRRGVRFQNGRTLTTRDIVFSLCRAATLSDAPRPYAKPIKELQAIEVLGVRDLKLRMPTNDRSFPVDVATVPIVAAPPDSAWEFRSGGCVGRGSILSSDFANPQLAAGTGPFRLVSYSDEWIVLEPNPSWRGRRAGWNRVELLLVKDHDRTRAILGGRIDILYAPPMGSMDFIDGHSGLNVRTTVSNSIIYAQFNYKTQSGLRLDDIRVRRALMLAIPRQLLAQRVKAAIGEPAGQVALPDMPEHSPHIPADEFNPAEAKRLMAEAGYADGFELKILTHPAHYRLARALAHFLADVGIRADVRDETSEQVTQRRKSNDYDIYCVGWTYNAVDMPGVLHKLLGGKAAGRNVGERNYGGYSDEIFDDLIAQARASTSPEKSTTALIAAAERAHNQAAWIPLQHSEAGWVLRTDLQMPDRPDRSMRLYDVVRVGGR